MGGEESELHVENIGKAQLDITRWLCKIVTQRGYAHFHRLGSSSPYVVVTVEGQYPC